MFYAEAFAVADTTHVLRFNIDNGFPSNNVYSLVQDNTGYLWFCTDNGVVKYNGYSFKIFNTSNSLPSNDVWKLSVDSSNRIWLCSHAYQIGYIKNDKYTSIIKLNRIGYPDHLEVYGDTVRFLLRDKYIHIITATDSVVNVKTIKDLHMFTFGPLIDERNNIFGIKFSQLYEGKLTDSIIRFRFRCSLPKQIIADEYLPGDFFIFNHFVYRIGGKRLQFIDLNNCEIREITFSDMGGNKTENFYTSAYNGDSVQFITNKAIYSFDSNAVLKRRTSFNTTLKTTSQVSWLFVDNFKNSWYATTLDGCFGYLRNSGLFNLNKKYDPLFETKCVGVGENGYTYWWDKKKFFLYKIDSNNHIEKSAFPNNIIMRGVGEGQNDELLLASNTILLAYKNYAFHNLLNDFKFKHFFKIMNLVDTLEFKDSTQINILFQNGRRIRQIDSTQFLILGVNSLSVLTFKDSIAYCNILDEERYTNVTYDSGSGNFIIYNVNKILLYNKTTSKILKIEPEFLNIFKINSIINIRADRHANVYILYNQGLFLYNYKLNRCLYIHCPFDLSNSLMQVNDGILYIAGMFGIAYAKISGPLSISDFSIAPNSKLLYYKYISDFIINKNKQIFINTDKGLYTFSTNALLSNNNLFKSTDPNFIRLVLNYPTQRSIKNGDTLKINERIQNIELDAINFLGSGNVKFLYAIEGHNTVWQQNASGEVFIGNLKPNIYYKVKCIVKDDLWESRETDFYLYIPPLWWQTRTAKSIFWISGSLVVIIFILAIILLTRFIVARSNEKKRILTELELRAIYAQINPHFIFNTLSSALFFINKKRFDDAYVHVNKFSRLLRAYIKSSQDRYITLAEEIEMLKNFIELQKTRFEEKFNYQIIVDNKVPIKSIKIPSLLLQPLVENAINHGLFHKKGEGLLILKFLQGENSKELICIIDDNGVGRVKAREIKKASAVQNESYGTKLTKQLIDIFKKYEHMDIYLEYIDKELPETGTIVKLTLKNINYVA